MKNLRQDNSTSTIKIATDVLLLKNPVGTAMGILFGFILHSVVILLSPFVEFLNNLRLNIVYYLAASVFGFNINYYFKQKKTIPQEVDDAFVFIQKQVDSGAISQYEAKLLRQALIRKVLESISINLESNHKTSKSQSTEKIDT
jgi:hypothetical protein